MLVTPSAKRRPTAFGKRSRPLRSRSRSEQARHSDEVVSGADEVSGKLGALEASEARSAEAADDLHPAEDLFDPFPNR